MDVKKYGKHEKRLVEQVGIARMWEFNQLVIAIIDKHGIEVGEAILEDLKKHAMGYREVACASFRKRKSPIK